MFKSLGNAAASGVHAVGRALPGLTVDVVGIGAVGLISYGAWRIYEPAGFIVGGILLLAGAVVLGAKSARRAG